MAVTLEYDELGNLLHADLADSESTLGIDYQVDAMGRRMSRVTTEGDEHYWVYQDALRPVGEVANGIFTQYVYANDSIGGAPDFMVRSGIPYRLIKDHIGSVRFVVNANTGAVMQELQYDPFGRVLADTSPGFQPFGFAGGLYDWDTELVRFGARDYDSGVGRWVAKDFIGFAGGQENLYVYAGGDPVNFVDPEGSVVFLAVPLAWGAAEWAGAAAVGAGLTWYYVGGGKEAVGAGLGALGRANDALWDSLSAITKQESPVWNALDPHKGKTRTNGTGSGRRFYEWDYTHGDIEVYDNRGRHLGSMDGETGEMYKPRVNGRKIKL